MTLRETSILRDWTGKVGTLFCVLFFLTLLDGFNARFREPRDYFPCLPGQSIAVTAPLPEGTGNLQELTCPTNSKGISVVCDSVQTGFWLGGHMWQGRILVSSGTQPGGYEVAVLPRNVGKAKPVKPFRVSVFEDEAHLRKASASYIRRYLGIMPWSIVPFFFFLIPPAFGAVFLLSRKAEALLAKNGKAEVYRVLKGETGYMIYFGLGLNQGILQGNPVALLDEKKRPTGTATVQAVFEDYSIAHIDSKFPVRPGFMVACSALPRAGSL